MNDLCDTKGERASSSKIQRLTLFRPGFSWLLWPGVGERRRLQIGEPHLITLKSLKGAMSAGEHAL